MNTGPRETLERLLDGYREWNAFPANRKGNRADADAERARFLSEIEEARARIVEIGDRVRSFDFEGRDDCYVEGQVIAVVEKEGCPRYQILVDRQVWGGADIANEPHTHIGSHVFPPVNGTPTLLGKFTDCVRKISEQPR